MKQHGFTIIEMMIVVAIVAIVGMIVIGGITGTNSGNTVSWGVNGMTEMRCINGYTFIVSHNGQARQVLDEFGKAAKCF